MARTVHIATPSRLHFGMFSFGNPAVRQFGGVGVMLHEPSVRLSISAADTFAVAGPLSSRIPPLVDRLCRHWHLPQPPRCRVKVQAAPPEHTGLGTGTQFDLGVTAGLNAFLGQDPLGAQELAVLSGRGLRSAIGTYGFLHGGLLVESGKSENEPLSPLEHRVELPEAWRFVLIVPRDRRGLAGDAERRAFSQLPPVPAEVTSQLRSEVADELLPAANAAAFERFGESLYRFGHLAGSCFAACQEGAFASERVATLVSAIRGLGVRGVGQSSWGPTVFALVENDVAARQLGERLGSFLVSDETWQIARPTSRGADLQVTNSL
jgi:beta-ribofuranosylaminobenzene 5'-phosphate synthase